MKQEIVNCDIRVLGLNITAVQAILKSLQVKGLTFEYHNKKSRFIVVYSDNKKYIIQL